MKIGDKVILGPGHPCGARRATVVAKWEPNEVRSDIWIVRLDDDPIRLVVALPSEMGEPL